MKIQPRTISSFIAKPPAAIKAVLIYGPDAGQVQLYRKQLLHAVLENPDDPFAMTELAYSDVKEQPSLLGSAMMARSFGVERSAIVIRLESATVVKDVLEVMVTASTPNLLIVTAGELAPSSALRKAFEKEDHLAALACYVDDERSAGEFVRQRLAASGFRYDNEVITLLTSRFAGDRMIMQSEIEKLLLYMGEERYITADAVLEVIEDSKEASLDDFCMAVASRQQRKVEETLSRLEKEGVAMVMVLRSLLRHMMRLQEAKLKMEQGSDVQAAMRTLKPPVFFKQAPLFQKQLGQWTLAQLHQMICELVDMEIEAKRSSVPVLLTKQLLMRA